MSTSLAIDLERLRRDLLELARFGGSGRPADGIDRPSFSDADMAARRWFMEQAAARGLETRLDGAGNAIARWQTGSGAAILIGSHLDSVPRGGLFDGALGVIAGLECVRALQDHGLDLPCPVEVIGTSEEEGRFGGMLGAQALSGTLDRDWFYAARDDTGLALTEAMRRQGLDPDRVFEAGRNPEAVKAFLELHIEQGPVLEARGLPVGIVQGISGVFNWTVTLSGTANHSGTTPMDLRRDAFRGLAEFACSIPRLIAEAGTDQSRLTIGKVELQPNFPHTVPGEAVFSLIGRDLDGGVMRALAEACRASLDAAARHHGLDWQYQEQSWLEPMRCHPDIVAAFRDQARALGLDALEMPSGAGHDTQFMAELTRAGMIFVPSVGGISHSPEEWTEWSDIEKGTNLLLHTLIHLARAG
ncbi:MAG: Zn-dependent hydrolase [Candidatus Competibacterales bacterium]|nr:Zn-dependent hydrolase [Candidatus Competibacterales bacterium]